MWRCSLEQTFREADHAGKGSSQIGLFKQAISIGVEGPEHQANCCGELCKTTFHLASTLLELNKKGNGIVPIMPFQL